MRQKNFLSCYISSPPYIHHKNQCHEKAVFDNRHHRIFCHTDHYPGIIIHFMNLMEKVHVTLVQTCEFKQ